MAPRKKKPALGIMDIETLKESMLYQGSIDLLIEQAEKLVATIYKEREKKNLEFEKKHQIPPDKEVKRLGILANASLLLAEATREADLQHADGYRLYLGKHRRR